MRERDNDKNKNMNHDCVEWNNLMKRSFLSNKPSKRHRNTPDTIHTTCNFGLGRDYML